MEERRKEGEEERRRVREGGRKERREGRRKKGRIANLVNRVNTPFLFS